MSRFFMVHCVYTPLRCHWAFSNIHNIAYLSHVQYKKHYFLITAILFLNAGCYIHSVQSTATLGSQCYNIL